MCFSKQNAVIYSEGLCYETFEHAVENSVACTEVFWISMDGFFHLVSMSLFFHVRVVLTGRGWG